MSTTPLHHGLIGESAIFVEMLATLNKIAAYDTTVLISGETGSGKELAARAIHYGSQRFEKPFVPLNCGAVPDHLIENELFGHTRGAYTDAREHQPGLIAQADGGTLFLDEVDSLSAKAQVCLLRFLQDGQFRPLGSSRTCGADVRVLAASNVDLAEKVRAGEFRPDLLYRLNFMELAIPPLRDRGNDAILLARHFISDAARRYRLPEKALHPETRDWLLGQPWPGNVRELQHRIQREFLLADGALIHIRAAAPAADRRVRPDRRRAGPPTLNFNEARQRTLEAFEHHHLTHLMRVSGGNVSHAARLAGKERRSLGRLLKKHSIDPQAFRSG